MADPICSNSESIFSVWMYIYQAFRIGNIHLIILYGCLFQWNSGISIPISHAVLYDLISSKWRGLLYGKDGASDSDIYLAM